MDAFQHECAHEGPGSTPVSRDGFITGVLKVYERIESVEPGSSPQCAEVVEGEPVDRRALGKIRESRVIMVMEEDVGLLDHAWKPVEVGYGKLAVPTRRREAVAV